MHFIVSFTDPKTEKSPYWLEITKCTVIAAEKLKSKYNSHPALAEVSILILLWWCAEARAGGDKLERTRSRWSRDNWNRPDLNSQPVTHRGARGTRARGRHKLRVNVSFVSWPGWLAGWCRSPWPPLWGEWGPPGVTLLCFRTILKYLKTGPPRRNYMSFFKAGLSSKN